ncbi:hypothetical protein Tco_1090706 [Tanacetum coccineum]|uniref:Uncharacterized protein n=1 Tax=Tanacetum coccineum TaxID=301880 RepID=A0ABQ5I524_9ASTR
MDLRKVCFDAVLGLLRAKGEKDGLFTLGNEVYVFTYLVASLYMSRLSQRMHRKSLGHKECFKEVFGQKNGKYGRLNASDVTKTKWVKCMIFIWLVAFEWRGDVGGVAVGWCVVTVVKMAVEARGILDRLDPAKRSIFEVDDIVIDEDDVIPENETPKLIEEFQNVDKRVPTIFYHERMEATLRDMMRNQFKDGAESAYHLEQSKHYMEN